eukprot:CAMPEP_0194267282 /NCGR_PEP_ID=MMETSP0169-20130528/1850_1 /TAXON_ID=218684 /ORGANISM="Corethron pennatum, Strain L29A3" /LENGTH=1197 /DNA_ID=CAMNT_0039008101 /DNA_START=304 /DNA_END=3897 /DNA_ORIENTATION=-
MEDRKEAHPAPAQLPTAAADGPASGQKKGGGRSPPSFTDIQAQQQETTHLPTSGGGSAPSSEGKSRRNSTRSRRSDGARSERRRGKPSAASSTANTDVATGAHGTREQGRIVTLLDGKYGFIACATRPEEVFFHYSELVGGAGNAGWGVGRECEFELRLSTHRRRGGDSGGGGRGGSNEGKMAAFAVRGLESGTVQWYQPAEGSDGGRRRTGRVLRPVRRRGSAEDEGTIQMDSFLPTKGGPSAEEGAGGDAGGKSKGNVVRFSYDACEGGKAPFKHEEVEFVLMVDRRTGDMVARNLKMIPKEEMKRERRGTRGGSIGGCERGTITSILETYGIITPYPRGDPIPFTIAPVDGDLDASVWAVGKEVEYTTVPGTLTSADNKTSKNYAANLIALPDGTIPKTVASGVTGTVTALPSSGSHGTVLLDTPFSPDSGGTVTSVAFKTDHSPGGFISRSSPMSLWTHVGDRFRFDITNQSKKYCLAPCEGAKRATIIGLAPLRQEGVVVSFRADSGYGFIRPVGKGSGGGDAYFRVGDILPAPMQKELLGEVGFEEKDFDKKKKRQQIKISEGMAIAFDLLYPTNPSNAGNRTQQQGYRATRLLVLPNSISLNKILAENAVGTVAHVHGHEFSVILKEAIKPMDDDQLYPSYVKFLDAFIPGQTVVLKEGQEVGEVQTIVAMAKKRNRGFEISMIECGIMGGGGSMGKMQISLPAPGNVLSELVTDGSTKVLLSPTGSSATVNSKPLTSLVFNRNDLLDASLLPCKGDTVSATIVQSHQNGQVHPVAVTVTSSSDGGQGAGFVADVVPGRQFGFITVLDENGVKRMDQQLFFHFSALSLIETDEGTALLPNVKRGDEVKFQYSMQKGKKVAKDVLVLPAGTLEVAKPEYVKEKGGRPCEGYLLLEPSHTTLAHTPSHLTTAPASTGDGQPGSRWDKVIFSPKGKKNTPQVANTSTSVTESGRILLFSDSQDKSEKQGKQGDDIMEESADLTPSGVIGKGDDESKTEENSQKSSSLPRIINFKATPTSTDSKEPPKRGDLVAFSVKSGCARDITVLKRRAAIILQGQLDSINLESMTAMFVASDKIRSFMLSEVVSCDASLLKKNEPVECILHDDQVYGVCRTSDLYLQTKASTGQRPRLNLSVKQHLKDSMGGTIMAQSCMAKGPERDSYGFMVGWTKRPSPFFGYISETWATDVNIQVNM